MIIELKNKVSQNLFQLQGVGVAVLVDLVVGDVSDLLEQVALALLVEVAELAAVHTLVEDQVETQGFQRGVGDEMLGCVGVVAGRRVDDIEGESQGLVQHLRDDAAEEGAGEFEAGVRIDLDEPGVELAVDHEVQSEDLEVVLVALGGKLHEGAPDRIETDGLHLGQDSFLKVVVVLGVGGVEILLEFGVGQLVRWLMAAVERSVLLDGVIGEVDLPLEVEDVELVGGSSDVALLVPVGLEDSVELADHEVVPDVELPLLVEEGTVDVELHDEGLFRSVLVLALALHDCVQFVDLVDDSDAVAAIGELSWFHDPDVPHGSSDVEAVLLILLLLADDGVPLLVVDQEALVLRIPHALLDVEGEWDDFEEVSSCEFVVLFEVVEEGLLVAQVEVVGEVVVHFLLLVPLLAQLQDLLPLPELLPPQVLDATQEIGSFEFGHEFKQKLIVLIPILLLWLGATHCYFLGRFFSELLADGFGGFSLLLEEVDRGRWLLFEVVVDLELRPDEVDVKTAFLDDLPPEPAFDELPHEWTVVAAPDPRLQPSVPRRPLLLGLLHVVVVPVAPVQPKEQLAVG